MRNSQSFIEFQMQIGKIKHLRRTGWLVRRVPNAETVAAHSWRMALMAMQKGLSAVDADVNHVIKMCLLHDVGESVIGDIIPQQHQTSAQKISDVQKQEMEKQAIGALATKYDFPDLEAFFDEYEGQTTLEARIAKNLDKLDMLLQAYEYMTLYPELDKLDEFMTFNEKSVDLPIFLPDLQEIKNRQEGKGKTPNAFIDNQISAGKLKHLLHNPVADDIDSYDTVASHRFRMALMALYLDEELKQSGADTMTVVQSVIGQDVKKTEKEQVIEDDFGLLEDIFQAFEYTKLYPNRKELKDYIEWAKPRIKTPSFKKIASDLDL